ncbi:MAG: hypothetical protein QOH17_2863 [Pseudonocardiales bacterium]|nr:hypothetical protein [Pseudonocardiales bacterium]
MRRFRAVRPQHGYVHVYVFEEMADALTGAEERVVGPQTTVEPVVVPVVAEEPTRGGPVGSVDGEPQPARRLPTDVDGPDGPRPPRRGGGPSLEEVGCPRSRPADEREQLAALLQVLDDHDRIDQRRRVAERLAVARRAKRAAARRATAKRLAAKRAALPLVKAGLVVPQNAAAHRAAILRAAARQAKADRAAAKYAAARDARIQRAVRRVVASSKQDQRAAEQQAYVRVQTRQTAVQQAARAAAVYR